MMLEKPKGRVQDLQGDERLVMLKLIRLLVQDDPQTVKKYGADRAEELFIGLINKGWMRICTDENQEHYWIEVYDLKTASYVKPQKLRERNDE